MVARRQACIDVALAVNDKLVDVMAITCGLTLYGCSTVATPSKVTPRSK